jgi:hypothetical protein
MQDSSKTKKNETEFRVGEKVDTGLGCCVGPLNVNASDLIEFTETFGGKNGRERRERLGGKYVNFIPVPVEMTGMSCTGP